MSGEGGTDGRGTDGGGTDGGGTGGKSSSLEAGSCTCGMTRTFSFNGIYKGYENTVQMGPLLVNFAAL